MSSELQTFAIFRIVGNSLPPRHSADNSIRSTLYILENEEEFEGCDKIWVLNKIADREHKNALIDLLRQRKRRFIDVPFDVDAHFRSFLDATGAPIALRAALKEQTVLPLISVQLEEWKIRHKSQKLVGINEARNIALKFGRKHYDWSVIADGGVIFSRDGWTGFIHGVKREPLRRIAILPMYRVYDWKSLGDYTPDGTQEEPQIAFHRMSEELFDPERRYGNQNKAELIARLGVPGPWQKWRPASWEIRYPLPAPNFRNYTVAGFVYRLPTDGAGKETQNARYVSRFRGVKSLSFSIDLNTAYRRRNPKIELLPQLPPAIDDQSRSRLKAFLEVQLAGPDLFVTDKTVPSPTGNVHDYYSIAPHYSAAGLKYDGYTDDQERVRKSRDADAFRNFAWRFYACAVGGALLEQPEYSQKAAKLLKAWFVDTDTRMNPSIRHAQVIPGSDEINEIGVVEFRQLVNVASAVRLLQSQGALEEGLFEAVREWIQQFLDDCANLGIREKALQRNNNIGTWSAALFGTLDLFCNRYSRAFSIGFHASERLGQQLGPFSVQINEVGRAKPLHYNLFNLAAWFNLLRFGLEFGIDVSTFSGVHNESLKNALAFCAGNRKQYSDYTSNTAGYDAWIATLEAVYHPGEIRRLVLVPNPHWGLPPIVSA